MVLQSATAQTAAVDVVLPLKLVVVRGVCCVMATFLHASPTQLWRPRRRSASVIETIKCCAEHPSEMTGLKPPIGYKVSTFWCFFD